MSHRGIVGLLAYLLLISAAWAQPEGQVGAGGYGMGQGMMGGGYGMGQGMMGGGYGMGPGMMWGYSQNMPNLTSEQQKKLAEIQKENRQKQWELMEKMHDPEFMQGSMYRDGKFDEQAARKRYDAMAALRKQMFENSLDAHKRMDSLLTPQQRQQLQGSAPAKK